MKKIFALCSMLAVAVMPMTGRAATTDSFLSCGDGFILVDSGTSGGIATAECQKLWCKDLETGKPMGSGTTANSGYKATGAPVELCDANNTCIQCFGDRNWCSGETPGVWNPQYGAYTKKGDDSNAFLAQQKGSCFGWSIQKPKCDVGETAILKDNKWVCAASGATSGGVTRAAAVKRTGTIRSVFGGSVSGGTAAGSGTGGTSGTSTGAVVSGGITRVVSSGIGSVKAAK